MRNTPKILCIATLGLLVLLLAQGWLHFIPVRELKGVSFGYEFPKLTFSSVADGSWQAGVEKYANEHFGFREPAIRLYNQYVWSCYHHSTNKDVIPGRNGYLYERYFVEDHYESRMYKYTDNPMELKEKFRLEAARLAKLQALLKERGTTLFVAILPGKDMLYPEYLPPQDTMTRIPGPRAYTEYLRLFNQYGINYIDVMDWFRRIKNTTSYPLMTPCGTHWSNIAATYAFDSIMRYMQSIGGAPIRPVRLGVPYTDYTREPDNDLTELLNLVVEPGMSHCQYVDVSMEPTDTMQRKPGLIVIGDSFFWNITYNYPLDSLFRYTHYWFYYNTIYFDSEHDNISQIDMVKAVEDADYIMLSYCTGQLYDLGNEFIGKTLVALLYTEEEIEAVRESICVKIRGEKNWMRYLKNKAAEQCITLERAVLNDADFLMQTHPEDYFEKVR